MGACGLHTRTHDRRAETPATPGDQERQEAMRLARERRALQVCFACPPCVFVLDAWGRLPLDLFTKVLFLVFHLARRVLLSWRQRFQCVSSLLLGGDAQDAPAAAAGQRHASQQDLQRPNTPGMSVSLRCLLACLSWSCAKARPSSWACAQSHASVSLGFGRAGLSCICQPTWFFAFLCSSLTLPICGP